MPSACKARGFFGSRALLFLCAAGGEDRVFLSETRRLSGRQSRKPRQGSSRDAEAEREPQQGSVPGGRGEASLRRGTYAGGQSARNPPRALVPHVSGPQLLYHGGVSSQAPGPAFPPAELFRGNALRFPAAPSFPGSFVISAIAHYSLYVVWRMTAATLKTDGHSHMVFLTL